MTDALLMPAEVLMTCTCSEGSVLMCKGSGCEAQEGADEDNEAWWLATT
jgi:hypothetical protein